MQKLYYGGDIITMRQESDTTEALLEKDGVIQYVGTLEEAEALCEESVHKICIAAAPNWKGLLLRCFAMASTPSVLSAAGSNRAVGTGWLFQITIRRCEMDHAKETALYYPRVWLYARTGSRHRSVAEHQLAELRDWAMRSGYRVVGQSCERARDNAFWRPGLFAMLKAVRRGEVDAVAVTRLSRFARKRSKLCKILAELQANDVMLITTDVSLRYQLYLYGLDRVIADCPKERNRCTGIHTANA